MKNNGALKTSVLPRSTIYSLDCWFVWAPQHKLLHLDFAWWLLKDPSLSLLYSPEAPMFLGLTEFVLVLGPKLVFGPGFRLRSRLSLISFIHTKFLKNFHRFLTVKKFPAELLWGAWESFSFFVRAFGQFKCWYFLLIWIFPLLRFLFNGGRDASIWHNSCGRRSWKYF